MGDWKYGFLAGLGFASMEPKRVVDTLAALGYESVEWTLGQFNPHEKSPEELAGIADITRQAGLEISGVLLEQDLVQPDSAAFEATISLVADCIKAAADNDIGVVNEFIGPAPWDANAPRLGEDIAQGEAWKLVAEALERLVEVAEEQKVSIAVEAVWGMLVRDYYTIQELFRQVQSPYLAVNMDPSHYALYRNDVPWAVRQLGEKIVHVHLKDAIGLDTGQPGDFIFPLLGEGMVEWSAFFGALAEIEYAGYCSVEFESFSYYRNVLGGDAAAAARLSMEQVEALVGAV